MIFDGCSAEHVMKIPQAFSLRFCILQAIKNWRRRRPGLQRTLSYTHLDAIVVRMALHAHRGKGDLHGLPIHTVLSYTSGCFHGC